MPAQSYNWTCSVCSITWVLQAIGMYADSDIYSAREQVGLAMGYPNCVNPTYGCMSAQCVIDTFAAYGLRAVQAWVSFDQAYAIARTCTGVINPTGMYHFMGIRGDDTAGNLWVANSAQGYRGVYSTLTRNQFDALGPTQIIYLTGYI